jgi:serine/threonine-protein kinase
MSSKPQDAGQAGPPGLLEQARLAAGAGRLREALELLERAPSTASRQGEALRLRGLVRLRLGELSGAVADLEAAAAGLGDHAACHLELGVARLRLGRFSGALASLQHCLRLEPDNAAASAARAGALLRLGRAHEALASISAAVSLEPDGAAHLHNRAVVLTELGRIGEAVRDYEQALALDPGSAGTLNNLAWLLATAPDPALRDGPRALDLAQRAVGQCRISAWLDTLAAAQAECGDLEAAVRTEREALERSDPPNPAFQARIYLYRRKKSNAELDAWRARGKGKTGSG